MTKPIGWSEEIKNSMQSIDIQDDVMKFTAEFLRRNNQINFNRAGQAAQILGSATGNPIWAEHRSSIRDTVIAPVCRMAQ